jgi:hypothetical protein
MGVGHILEFRFQLFLDFLLSPAVRLMRVNFIK